VDNKFDWSPYGYDRWLSGEVHDALERIVRWEGTMPMFPHTMLGRRPKPFLTAADIVMLREMKVGL